MNLSSFDRILRQMLLVPIVALLLGAAALVWQMRSAAATVNLIELDDDRISLTLRMEQLIVDQETALRGYQTTGDAHFLEPYFQAEKKLPAAFEARRRMIQTDARRAEFNDLVEELEAWQNGFAEPLMAAIKAGAKTGDLDLNLTGKREMDDMRARLVRMNELTEQRRALEIAHWRRQVHTLTYALLAAAVLLGVLLGVYARRRLSEASKAFQRSQTVLRERADEAYRSEQRLRATLQSIGEGVVTCDAEGCVSGMNAVAQELTGWQEADALGKPIENVFKTLDETTRQPHEGTVAIVKRQLRAAFARPSLLVRRDGSELLLDESGAPIRNKAGELIGIVLVLHDSTLARRSQQALVANERLAVAGRLAATIAHEIHNPLDSVSNLLFLMDGKSTPEESAEFLRLAQLELARVTQISRAMLSLHRESRAPVAIDLREMLLSLLLLMESRFLSLGVTVQHALPEGLLVLGFPAELRQVFGNLLGNAAEASGEGGNVRLSAVAVEAPQPGVAIAIEDHGPGVPEEIRDKLFKPFFTTKGEQGTGLGLWVSQGIVHKHAGTIDFASSTDPDEHGTTVTVFLPLDPSQQLAAA